MTMIMYNITNSLPTHHQHKDRSETHQRSLEHKLQEAKLKGYSVDGFGSDGSRGGNIRMAEEITPPLRLVNFVSEEQLDQAKKTRGECADDGTAQRDRPLFEILKDNKDKRDAEFNERFKHRPPKALDEDETEFLEKLQMSKMEYERQLAEEETQQLRSFQAAVAVHSSIVHELKETPSVPKVEDHKPLGRKKPTNRPLSGLIVTVKPQLKKAKTDATNSEKRPDTVNGANCNTDKSSHIAESSLGGLVSYSDESEDDS
ncbi:hypothetical protein NE237_015984 [Protea cynaroides]|uniref:FAM192A/Fyv6 N-terminal domain-containing protein n=1 Tax=Protea cynaroides TaxID=273540 RepID=A0A9Q0QRL6_9MAGN|nr:hypothetical protein NE237_015984 [Protea cynaroides]